MQPNANLTTLHFVAFSVAMIAIYAWGMICLEAEMARTAPVIIAFDR